MSEDHDAPAEDTFLPAEANGAGDGLSPKDEASHSGFKNVDKSFFIVGVGASAGGLEAIKAFLAPIPADCPHSFVFVQHMSPDYKSLMGELLRRETSLRIAEVQDDMPIEPGHVYIIPPKSNVIIQGTHVPATPNDEAQDDGEDTQRSSSTGLRFELVTQPPRPQLNLPIDLFFQSLSEAVGERAVAVILSGTGSDGSRGLRTVKDADGMVMVQSPETAAFDGMPMAAISTQLADIVLPPEDMARELYRHFELHTNGAMQIEAMFEDEPDLFDNLIHLVSEDSRIDFSRYRRPTLYRRIARRMTLTRCSTLAQYVEFASQDADELALLCREFLIGVTHFFRDYPGWEALRKSVLPRIFAPERLNEQIKIWSVGCSTGEEAYTIAMLVDMYLRENNIKADYRVFATDVNENAIAFAKEGLYPESAAEDVPKKYVGEYFAFRRGGISISENLRNHIVFSTHNVTKDPPYIKTDLLICRNMLIYMTPPLQAQLLTAFSFALRTGGFLFLGASESIERGYSRFQPVDVRWRIFSNVSKATARDTSSAGYSPSYAPAVPAMDLRRNARPSPGGDAFLRKMIGHLLTGINSCAVIVNDYMQIIDTYGEYRSILSLPGGAFSVKLFDLVPERLATTLSIVLRRAERQGSADYGPVRVERDGKLMVIYLSCIKAVSDTGASVYAVVFREQDQSERAALELAEKSGPKDVAIAAEQASYVRDLEAELAALRETLEATFEDLGVSNEALQTSNEELMSANEELQSTNEEVQSANEELHTINGEHTAKIAELEAAYADIDNLLNSTEIATVFLDNDLRIRRFSDSIRTHFNLDTRDVGRPLTHFSSSLNRKANQLIQQAVQDSLDQGTRWTEEVQNSEGNWFLARVRPFEDVTGEKGGVVLTFVDITKPKALQEELAFRRDMLEALIEGESAGYWDWKMAEGTEYYSPRFKSMLGYADDEIENVPESWQKLIHPDDLSRSLQNIDEHVRTRGDVPYLQEARYRHKDGSYLWVLCRGSVIEWSPNGKAIRMTGLHIDINDLRIREEETLRRAEDIRRFAYISAHDLREPMRVVQNFVGQLRDRIAEKIDKDDQQMLDFVTEAATRMDGMIAGVLDYAKLEDGTFENENVDMAALVDASLTLMSEVINDTNARVEVRDLPNCLGSAKLIGRVLGNVISNALKFRSTTELPHVIISGTSDPKGMIHYQICDNGIGIDPKFRKKVFEIFFRLHTREDYEGTGLGMALCRKMIEQQGGRIWIDDGNEGGVTVHFTLPAAKET